MLKKIAALRKRHQRTVSVILSISVVLAYSLHSILPNFLSFENATGYSLSLILVYLFLLIEIREADRLNHPTSAPIVELLAHQEAAQ